MNAAHIADILTWHDPRTYNVSALLVAADEQPATASAPAVDDLDSALAQIRTGLEFLRRAAASSDSPEHADRVLRAIHDHRDAPAGALYAFHSTIRSVAEALEKSTDRRGPLAAAWVTRAAERLEDGVCEDVDRARESIAAPDDTPLLR
ncbi:MULTISPECIES: hypothetical protein [Streptomyces]|uniref:hypothetical protein n=1 Tax=Streptomyces TaxID=1883 RepID=UPI00345B8CA2